jgi:putative colanic acid biosynthesis acetyltransferase WcaF
MQRSSPHSLGHRIGRVVWGLAYLLLFRPSPRPLHRWRNWLLRLFGARLHPKARVYPRARIWAPWNLIMDEAATIADDVDVYSAATIRIGAYATVSQYSFLCAATHDYNDITHPLVVKPIVIGWRSWIAADVFISPGVTIGEGAVVGARSSVFSDLPAWMVCAGTPAKPLRKRELGPDDFASSTTSRAPQNFEPALAGEDRA